MHRCRTSSERFSIEPAKPDELDEFLQAPRRLRSKQGDLSLSQPPRSDALNGCLYT